MAVPKRPRRPRKKIAPPLLGIPDDSPLHHIHETLHRHRRAIRIGLVVSVVVTMAIQVLYPRDYAVPFARLDGSFVGFQQRDQLAIASQKLFEESKVVLRAGDKTVEAPLAYIGAEVDAERTSAEIIDYPLWQRLIPFSMFAKWPHAERLNVYYADGVLREFTESTAAKLSYGAEDAYLTIADGRVTTTTQKPGQMVSADRVSDTLSAAWLSPGGVTVLVVDPEKIQPKRTDADLASVRSEAEQMIAKTFTITAGDQEFTPVSEDIASWLALSEDASGVVSLRVDQEKIKQYFSKVNDVVKVDAGTTMVVIENGVEKSRTVGADGKALDGSALALTVEKVLRGEMAEARIAAPVTAVAPVIKFSTGYTSSQEGLQAYIDHVARTRNISISVIQLGGPGWRAGARDHESRVSGSTYKLYVSLWLFQKIKEGAIGWNSPILDTNVAGCFERMTVASTNPCAEKFIEIFGGREALNDFVHANGFSASTVFSSNEAARSSAADLSRFMIGLDNGSLVSGADRDRLLSSLSRHPYRYGIPTGSKAKVFDKVGFIWDYVNDTGIVDHPRGKYIVTIMTKGESYGRIAEVTREIERILYP